MVDRLSYADLWPDFLRAHSKPLTRAAHYFGITAGVGLAGLSFASGDWRLLIAAVAAPYAVGFASHALIEGNQPASFTHPIYSIVNAARMYALWITGSLRPELAKAGLRNDTLL